MAELLDWPWRRFERFYEAFLRREAIDGLEARKNQMIGSLWANSNYDDDKGTRRNAIEEIEEQYDNATRLILFGKEEEEEEIDENNPFFAPAMRAIREIEAPRDDEGDATVKDVVGNEYSKYIDQ